MDKEVLLELVPHYVAMVVLVLLVLTLVRLLVGDLGFWVELAIIIVLVFAYRPAVQALGVAPEIWEE